MNLFPHYRKLLRLLAPLLVAAALAPAPSAWGASSAIIDAIFHVGSAAASSDRDRDQVRPIAEPYSHLGLSLLPTMETPSPSEGVKGLRFNLLVGRHRELRGLDIGVIGNEVTGSVNALQIAGIYNWVGDPAGSDHQFTGIQLAGIMNHSAGNIGGLQCAGIMNHNVDGSGGLLFAGIMNHSAGDFGGLQCAGILNYCDGEFSGMQAAGVCNVVDGRMYAVLFQVAGILNYCAGDFIGLRFFPQIAGVMNYCADDFFGPLQVAGAMNYCANDFYGWQAAGVCNVAGGTMRGFQLGLVNYTDHLKGLQIGAVNLAGTGCGVQIGLWNSAKSLEGLQIGLCNVNTDSSMPFFPIVNYSF